MVFNIFTFKQDSLKLLQKHHFKYPILQTFHDKTTNPSLDSLVLDINETNLVANSYMCLELLFK